jgi:hypothetical protein
MKTVNILPAHWAAISMGWTGSASRATVPPPSSFASVTFPPCASAIVAQIVSPRPRPCDFVV